MTRITQDLSQFGFRELAIAEKLLRAYALKKWASEKDHLGEGVAVVFNTHSGLVFLSDDFFNAAVLNDKGELENWLYCSGCGAEGVRSEVDFFDDATCQGCIREEVESMPL